MAVPTVDPTALVALRGRAGVMAHERTMPVLDALAEVVPGASLVRGQVIAVCGVAEASLALALAAQATRTGSWLAVVESPGRYELGVGAAAELGVVVERTVIVEVTPDDAERSADVVAALVDGFDVVVVPSVVPLRPAAIRRVQARLRTRGGVVVVVGDPAAWEPDLVLRSAPAGPHGGWDPLGETGRLRSRRVVVDVRARRRGGPQCHVLWLPTSDGAVARADIGEARSLRGHDVAVARVG